MPRELRPRKAKEAAAKKAADDDDDDEDEDSEEEEREDDDFEMEAPKRRKRDSDDDDDDDDDDDEEEEEEEEEEEAPRRRPRRKAAEEAQKALSDERPKKRRKRDEDDDDEDEDDFDVEALLEDDDEESDDDDEESDAVVEEDREEDDDEDAEEEEKEKPQEEEEASQDFLSSVVSAVKEEPIPRPKEAPKKLTPRDAAMTSRRRLRPALIEPPYDLELVPVPPRDGAGSYLRRVEGNDAWEPLLPEIVLLCDEAAWRRAVKDKKKMKSPPVEAKPLMLEYISDRVDTDDPIFGFVLRSQAERWLQGFAMVTTFTTWTPYLRFTTTAPSAAVTLDDAATRVIADDDLVAELQSCRRAGDFEAEGVVWPKVAEFSLLGSLGFGGQLAKIVIDELASDGKYDYVVLQATDQAVRFYEKLGFARIGAVASFERPKNLSPSSPENFDPPKTFPSLGSRLYWARRLTRSLLRKCVRFDDDLVFALPVDETLAPDYSSIVSTPMDLQTMRRKTVDGAEPALAAASYLADDLEQDIQLMVNNCLKYNDATSYLAKYAQRYLKKTSAVFSAAKERYADLYNIPEDAVVDTNVARDFDHAADADDAVLGYVHWTFPDQPVEDQYPSYLMAKRLRAPGASAGLVLTFAADDALAIASASAAAATAAVAAIPDIPEHDLDDDAADDPMTLATPRKTSSDPEEPETVVKEPLSKEKPERRMPLDLVMGTRLTFRNAVPVRNFPSC